jgi:hypothetical protein
LQEIRTYEEYIALLAEVEHLIAKDPEPESVEGDRLNLIAPLLEVYEKEKFPIQGPEGMAKLFIHFIRTCWQYLFSKKYRGMSFRSLWISRSIKPDYEDLEWARRVLPPLKKNNQKTITVMIYNDGTWGYDFYNKGLKTEDEIITFWGRPGWDRIRTIAEAKESAKKHLTNILGPKIKIKWVFSTPQRKDK